MTINERASARMWNKERTRLEAEIGKRDEAIAHLQIVLERAAHEVSYGTPATELHTIKQWMREAFEVISSVEQVLWSKSKRDELVARAMRQIEVAESTPDLEESDPDLEPDPPRNDMALSLRFHDFHFLSAERQEQVFQIGCDVCRDLLFSQFETAPRENATLSQDGVALLSVQMIERPDHWDASDFTKSEPM